MKGNGKRMKKMKSEVVVPMIPKNEQKWWHRAVVYQIYPRSFQDTNGDGIGDIKGIIQHLDYLKKLGINTIWMNPIFVSPQDDNGYDISDFYAIDPDFGTLDDVKELIAAAHKRDIKIVFDLVLSHTSNEHEWFKQASKDKNSEYRDYYIWENGKNGSEPTNWASFFGGSLWEYNKATDDYYMHLFSKKMPDLNWDNERLRAEMYKVANYWTTLGIDGFRLDAIVHLQKNKKYPQAIGDGKNPYVMADEHYANLPEVHQYVQEFYKEVLDGKEILTIGEAASADVKEAIRYTDPSRNELNMIVSFKSTGVDRVYRDGLPPGSRDPEGVRWQELKAIMKEWQQGLYGKGWNTLFWNNHDMQRLVSHYGDDKTYRVESAKMLAALMYLQWGVPFLLQGEEIGMTNAYFNQLSQYRDTSVPQLYHDLVTHYDCSEAEAMDFIMEKSRDNSRTPVQWNSGDNAGFTTGNPWMDINPNKDEINVEASLADPNSIFYFYQKLLDLKKNEEAFVYGYFEPILESEEAIYAYTRTYGTTHYLVLCNLGEQEQHFNLDISEFTCVLSNYDASEDNVLAAYETRIYQRTN